MAENADRLQFDIAFALSILSPLNEFPLKLSKKREFDNAAEKILDDCIDRKSFHGSSCRILDHLSAGADYHLKVGNDRLTLFPGGYIRAGGSGVTIQLLDKSLARSYALKVPRVSVLAYKSPRYEALDEEHLQSRFNAEYIAF